MTAPGLVGRLLLALVLLGVTPALAIDGRARKELPETSRAYSVVGVVDTWANVRSGVDFVRERRPGTPVSPAEALYVDLAACIQDRGLNYQAIVEVVERYMAGNPEQSSGGMSGSCGTR
jgi:hypothetical protein